MADLALTDADRDAIREILHSMRVEGAKDPILPTDVDLDGDGTVDGYGLDAEGNVVTLPSVPLSDTLYEATGEEGE